MAVDKLIRYSGAFVAAPTGGLLFAFAAFALRIGCLWTISKYKGQRFDAFDRPPPLDGDMDHGGHDRSSSDTPNDRPVLGSTTQKGTFF